MDPLHLAGIPFTISYERVDPSREHRCEHTADHTYTILYDEGPGLTGPNKGTRSGRT